MGTKYTYQALGLVNLTYYPFQKSYLIPGVIDTYNEAFVIAALSQGEGFNKQSNLDGILGVSRPVITMLLEEMREKGLVTRSSDTEDKRGFILDLTPYGKKIAAWMNYRTKMINKIQLRGFTNNEIEMYNHLSLKMAENMLDVSDRDLLKLPKFNSTISESKWNHESENPSFIPKEDRELLFELERKTKKLLKKQTA